MILQEEYNLNLESQLSKKYVKVSQYDTGRRLIITLLKNDCSMFKIPSEASASINGLKPDGKGFRYDCSIENNKVVVDMKEQMTVLAGYVKCEILLSKGGERIATANFMLSVEESPLSENTPISSTDIPLLQKAIEASETVLSVEKTVKGYSESASKSSQSAQKSAESASNASASSAASARNSSQSAQASAESANNASQSATNAQESAESASNSVKEAKASAESAIQTKTEVEQLKQETVEQTKTLTESAEQEISTVKDATVLEVNQFKNDTISDITSIKDRAVEEVAVIKADAKAEADKAKESETNAKMSETNASNSAKEAKASADSVANVVSDVSKLKEDTAALQKRQNVLIGSETGNPISCDDAFEAPLCGLHIYGKSTQDGTPTPDAPVPIVSVGDGGNVVVKMTGKNLLDSALMNPTFSDKGISAEQNSDGSYTISGTPIVDGTIILWIGGGWNNTVPLFTIPPGSYYSNVSIFYYDGKTRTSKKDAFTLLEPFRITGIMYAKTYDINKRYNFLIAPQLELGSTATAYSPYRKQLITLPTPNGLLGIPVSSGGNYTDSTGQQWVCDEVDLARGVKVQRVNRLKLDDLPWRYELTPTNKNDTFISTVSASQYGTDRGFSLCQYAVFDGVAYDIEMAENCRCYVWINSVTIQFKAGSGVNSLDAFSEWLKARPDASIYYCLATPQRNHAYSC